MALGFVSGGILLLCALTCAQSDYKSTFQQSAMQVPVVVECNAHSLFISVPILTSNYVPHFEAVGATGVYAITEDFGAQCGYTYSVQPLLGRVVLRASYFSCHTLNQNDEVFTFMFRMITVDENGKQSYFNISQTCSVPPFSPREVTCEENYLEVSVRTDLPCPTDGTIKEDFSAAHALAQSSAVEAWQVMLQQQGRMSAVMSPEQAAALGYFIMVTPGRLVFRTTFGQPYSSVEMVNGVAVEVIRATVFFRQNWMVVMVDLVAACSLDQGSFDGHKLHWKTPAVMTPLAVGPTELRSDFIGMGVDGKVVDQQDAKDRGYSVTVSDTTVKSSIPFAAEGGTRTSFVMDNMYYEMYKVLLSYQQKFLDQNDVATKKNVARPMSTPPIPRPPYTVNQTVPDERVFTVYLGNIPFDVELVSVELNGHLISVSAAPSMGYLITRVSEGNNTFAYILKVSFDDQFVMKQYISGGFFKYTLDIKWNLQIMPQMDPYTAHSPVSADTPEVSLPTFDGTCADNGMSFTRKHQEYDYLWVFTIGDYLLTQQLASDRGYIFTNDSSALTLSVPLFTIGYIYENITLQHFYGTFELLAKNAQTLTIEQSSAKQCLFQTTELLVCSSEGVMTVVSDITKAVPSADPARTTLLDPSCGPQETDGNRVLFSFGLNTCGTKFRIDQQYVTYENEIIFHEVYSTDRKPVITRDAAYRITVMCIYPVYGTESIFADLKLMADTPGTGQISSPVKVPPQVLKPVQQSTVVVPSFQAPAAQTPIKVPPQVLKPIQQQPVMVPSFQAPVAHTPVKVPPKVLKPIQQQPVMVPSFQSPVAQKPLKVARADRGVHPHVLKPLQQQTIMKPSFQATPDQKQTSYMHVGQWAMPHDKRSHWSLGP